MQQQLAEEVTSGRSSQASSSSIPFRPSVTLGTRHRRRRSEQAVHDLAVSHAQVDFFLSLPEKVRKQHFSRDEQRLLQARCEQAFLPDQHEAERAQQRFHDFHFDFARTSHDTPARPHSQAPSSSASSAISPTRGSFGLPLLKRQNVLTTANPSYLDMLATPIFTTKESLPYHLRRTTSLTAASTRRPSSGTALALEPPFISIRQRPQHQRAHSSSLSGRRSSHAPAPLTFDPEATHYQNPEARKKLRMYLASPQKFDEAIEFGFPSTTGNDTSAPHYQLPQIDSHARKFSRDMQSFLRDGKLSFLEDNSGENQGLETDADSLADMDSPTTPSSTGDSFRLHSRETSFPKCSLDSNYASSPNHHGSLPVNREMTLRMTLTRPDLRAEEDHLYGWQGSNAKAVKDDPLALEDLVLTDDMTGTKGAFYIKPKARGNLVTRLLKRASLKAR